ncbi:hypothetical protein [Streptomyces sp. NPDC090021]|uniref:hypothetical protein n=1 Tax=Streptomyces sp. NPDC090021 TaxID=3365919 RepID=UPI00380F312F
MRLGFHFHTELMKMNGITLQAAITVSTLDARRSTLDARRSTLDARRSAPSAPAALTRGTDRGPDRPVGAPDGRLLPDHPLRERSDHGRIEQWAATAPAADRAEILQRWEALNACAGQDTSQASVTRTPRPARTSSTALNRS